MKRFLKGLGIFLALVGVGVVSAFAVVALLLRQEEVRVPDLTGQDIMTVIDTIAQQGLLLKVERSEPHPTLPKNAVITQMPLPGNGIKKGRPIRVVVSLGPSEMRTPKLVGEQSRKVELLIRQAGFFLASQARVSSETAERDVVIAQAPLDGTALEKGANISLLISSGKKPSTLIMPKLVGKRAESAIRTVDRLGLQHRIIFKAAGEKAITVSRTVITQKPGAGYPVAADGMVELVVNK